MKPHKEDFDLCITWFLGKEIHREDGPAIEWKKGRKDWYIHGVRHRDDGPAIIHADGTLVWYQHGFKHREDGPAVQMRADDYNCAETLWYYEDRQHREDGPAVERFSEGKLHREWWINDVEMTEEEFNHWLKKKQLNEKLQSTLAPRPLEKKKKI